MGLFQDRNCSPMLAGGVYPSQVYRFAVAGWYSLFWRTDVWRTHFLLLLRLAQHGHAPWAYNPCQRWQRLPATGKHADMIESGHEYSLMLSRATKTGCAFALRRWI